MEYIKVYADDDLRAALHTTAQARGLSDAELARRLISRGLAIDGSDAQAVILAEAVRAVVRDEIRPVRRLAYIAAREGGAAHRFGLGVVGTLVRDVLGRPPERVQRARDQAEAEAMRYAVERLRDDVEPADPADDAPEALPAADEEVEVDPDTAEMLAGS